MLNNPAYHAYLLLLFKKAFAGGSVVSRKAFNPRWQYNPFKVKPIGRLLVKFFYCKT